MSDNDLIRRKTITTIEEFGVPSGEELGEVYDDDEEEDEESTPETRPPGRRK